MADLGFKSVEDVSVLRKFVIFFVLLSVIPFLILAALFVIFAFSGELQENTGFLLGTFVAVGGFMVITFFAIRATLKKIRGISKDVGDAIRSGAPKAINLKGAGDNEIVQIARSFNEVVKKLEMTIGELERSKDMLQDVLTKVASGVSFAENINAFLDLIMKTTVGAVDARYGLLLLFSDTKSHLEVRNFFGFAESDTIKQQHFGSDIGALDWVIRQKKPLLMPLVKSIGSKEGEQPVLGFAPPFVCVPLIYSNDVIGAMVISGKTSGDNFSDDDLLIVSNIASQVALAISNATLNANAQRSYMETITALAMAVEARDVYSRGHSDRVSEYSVKIARNLGLSEQQVNTVKEAAELHDVGKIGISDEILRKPTHLDEYEFEVIRQHPVIGEGIIMPLTGFFPLREPIRHHHEWLNGQGYPDKLQGTAISLEARILTVADCYDAMTTDRPYRKAMSSQEAKAELMKYRGVRYDPAVVDAMIAILEEKVPLPGTSV